MKTTAIIAEYDPFHNGHLYHMQKTREITGADYIVAVMGGNFLQRGVPAFFDKYTRTQMALSHGADLVLELPVYYATGSAEYFAMGAAALLDKLGAIDAVCFGSECGDLALLSCAAHITAKEPAPYKERLQSALREGKAYPAAKYAALLCCMQETMPEISACEEIFSAPNNILAIEYLKALQKRASRIQPYTIARSGSGHHDTALSKANSSASAIRQALGCHGGLSRIKKQLPPASYALLEKAWETKAPLLPDDLSFLLQYRLLLLESEGFSQFFGVSKELSNKISNNLRHFQNFTAFAHLLKSKDLSYAHVCRALLHILLSATKENMQRYQETGLIQYARMLGFSKSAAPLLSRIKRASSIPLISKPADAARIFSGYPNAADALSMFLEDIRAAHVYDAAIQHKFHIPPFNEYQANIINSQATDSLTPP